MPGSKSHLAAEPDFPEETCFSTGTESASVVAKVPAWEEGPEVPATHGGGEKSSVRFKSKGRLSPELGTASLPLPSTVERTVAGDVTATREVPRSRSHAALD